MKEEGGCWHLGSVDINRKIHAAKGNYPSAPIQQFVYFGQWGHVINVMKREV